MKKKTTSLATRPEKEMPMQISSVETLMAQAIAQGTPVETMKEILAMRKELRAEAAKEAFDDAMAAFQGECPVIKKTRSVFTNDGKLAYRYAPLDTIVGQVKGILSKHGFSYTINTETKDRIVKSTCIAKHKNGHSESTSVEVPLGNKTPIMSDTQVVAAALTFAKRYAFTNAFGILTGDEDTDSRTPDTHPATPAAKAKPAPTGKYLLRVKDLLHKRGAKDEKQALAMVKKETGVEWKKMDTVSESQAKFVLALLLNK